MKRLTNESGLTLIELLATLVITTMIGLVAYAVLHNGFKTYDRVKIETALRDEADIIMAELMSHMFTLKTSEIESRHLHENNAPNNYLLLKNGEKLGFFEGKLHVDGQQNKALVSDHIQLGEETEIKEVTETQFHITLSLEWVESGQTLTIESEIGIINDK